MTHDELLTKIDNRKDYAVERFGLDDGFNALRAVVTLCDFLNKKGKCCVPVQEVIDAIEKELN